MKLFIKFLVLLFLSLFSLAGCSDRSDSQAATISASFVDASLTKTLGTFNLELATTEGQRSLGLMYRKSMSFDHGMLFVFEQESPQSFWMKNTEIALDIIFIDKNFKVVAIQADAVPYTTSARDSNGNAAKYVVELNAGTAKRLGIDVGTFIKSSYFDNQY